jgi:hypothetical protein
LPDRQRKINNYLPIMLKDPDMRRAACAVEAVFRAATILDELPPACLEEVRDYCSNWNKGRKGTESEFKKVWVKMVTEHLADAKLAEKRLFYGLTGKVAGLEEHELRPERELRRTANRGDPGDPIHTTTCRKKMTSGAWPGKL